MATSSTTSVVSSGSTTYVTGTISGLDTNSLVEAAVAQKTSRADTIDAKVAANEAKISSYRTLRGLLEDISDAVSGLTATTYSALGSTNAFDAKKAYVTASNGSDATKLLAVSADATAVAASYEVGILQLATAMKVAGAEQSGSTALGAAGSFSLGLADGQSASITVTESMTLSDLAKAINAQSDTTGVSATLLKVGTDAYRLVLTAGDTNKAIVATSLSGSDVLSAVGLTNADGAFSEVLQQAKPSIVTIDGITITSDSSELTGVVPGLSLSLDGVTGEGVTIRLDIETDLEGVKTAITDFISAYNALRAFVVTNQAVGSDGSVSDDATLFGDSILRAASKALADLLGRSPASADALASLADFGITLGSSNELVLSDETALDNALLVNLSGLASFFETSFEASDSTLKLLKNDTSRSYDFVLDLTYDDTGALSGAMVSGQSGLFTVSGSRIIGVEGSAYEGLSFALGATTPSQVSIRIDQGFANLVQNLLKAYTSSSGQIQIQIESLETRDKALSEKAEKIRDAAETYRTRLVDKYARMEQALYAAQLVQKQIRAILGAGQDDDD